MFIKTSDHGVQKLSPRKGIWKLGIPKSENADRGLEEGYGTCQASKVNDERNNQKRTDTHKKDHVEEFGS